MDTVILQFKDIKGNSMIDGYADGIILYSFSHSVSMPMNSDTSNTERTMGRPSFSEFSVTKATDQATPALYAACAAGTKLGDATISIGRNEGGKFMLLMKYVLTNAMISHISTGGGSSEMSDSVTIHFTQITSQYTQQSTDSTKKGNASFGWDLAANKAASAS
ncbi:type VI secretion system tube protein Hcp [Trinickia sp. NRRL B-1857]|uniref:Hcp family type VI secretion system effector n=1 Tax=Trinickia sp. NRRL B-1857 TaxID=3162879 RepID=UPI003D282365